MSTFTTSGFGARYSTVLFGWLGLLLLVESYNNDHEFFEQTPLLLLAVTASSTKPYNLTAWGFAGYQRHPNGWGFSSGLGRLFLPGQYDEKSVYTRFHSCTRRRWTTT